ncbi:MAG: hypothetical protein RLY71_1573 [Pseudomonadota bacterium]|jgi:hypothetical protein
MWSVAALLIQGAQGLSVPLDTQTPESGREAADKWPRTHQVSLVS